MAKKQKELSGFERPSIEAIDNVAAEHLDKALTAKTAKEEAEMAKSLVLAAMADNVDKLEKDENGDHVYPFVDGDTEKVFVLTHKDALRVRNAKKTTEPAGEIG